jgi:hypothetical protein
VAQSSTRRPANIPLHTLNISGRRVVPRASSVSPQDEEEKRPLEEEDESDTSDSWTDTGDLVDQLAEQEDPLHQAFAGELPERGGALRGKKNKKVHYDLDEETEKQKAGVVRRKEDIPIPSPPPRRISFGERVLVLVMAPNDGPSRLHGLHGKKLM